VQQNNKVSYGGARFVGKGSERHFPFFSCFPLLKPVSSGMVDHR